MTHSVTGDGYTEVLLSVCRLPKLASCAANSRETASTIKNPNGVCMTYRFYNEAQDWPIDCMMRRDNWPMICY